MISWKSKAFLFCCICVIFPQASTLSPEAFTEILPDVTSWFSKPPVVVKPEPTGFYRLPLAQYIFPNKEVEEQAWLPAALQFGSSKIADLVELVSSPKDLQYLRIAKLLGSALLSICLTITSSRIMVR